VVTLFELVKDRSAAPPAFMTQKYHLPRVLDPLNMKGLVRDHEVYAVFTTLFHSTIQLKVVTYLIFW
jgi:hypothetical protein